SGRRVDASAELTSLLAPGALGSVVSDATVTLAWTAPTSFPASTYVVEAGSASGLADLLYVDTGSRQTTFTASPVSPGNYFVRIRARSEDGTMSAASNEILVAVGQSYVVACVAAQAPPGPLSSGVDGSTVTLDW